MNTYHLKLLFFPMLLVASSCKVHNLFQDTARQDGLSVVDSIFLDPTPYDHRIRIDDKISIGIWGEDQYSVGSVYGIYNSNEVYGKWLLVDSEGNIEVPEIGTMYVVGLTVPKLKEVLRIRYREWLKNPIVDVKILNKEITILGEVRNPGVHQVDTDRNYLLDIVAKSGGFEDYAYLKSVKVLRQVGPHVQVANINLTVSGVYRQQNLQVWPGDMIVVPAKRHKEFDRRISTIIPFTSTATAAAILMGSF